MAWQSEVGSGTNRAVDYHDLMSKIVGMATSQHVATVAINNGGTGGAFVIGDIITLTHAGALLDARFEVTAVAAGQITGLRINDSGAFSNRVVSAVVGSSGGSNYVIGDVLEIQGGTQREKAKVKVATLSGSAVATVSVFENGGAYSVVPGASDTTVGIGPSGFAGDNLCTITSTMTGLIGTTGLAVTGGGGTGATVDITIAQTGWTVDGRNTNNRVENSLLLEKECTLVGDASGLTNAPYVAMISNTRTSGLDTRYAIAVNGAVAHNPSLPLWQSPKIHPSIGSNNNFLTYGAYLLCPQNKSQEIDFWFSIDDRRIVVITNVNPAAVNTDNGIYMRMHMGLMNGYGTESENPYTMMVGASSIDPALDPTVGHVQISGMPECVADTGRDSGWFFYETDNAAWRNIKNSTSLVLPTNGEKYVTYPFGRLTFVTDGSSDNIVGQGVGDTFSTWSNVTRTSPAFALRPIPGTSAQIFLWPINIISRNITVPLGQGPRGEVRGMFFLTATDASGAQIANFSEDYITVGTRRFRVFHNHTWNQRHQFIALEEDS